MPRPLQHRWSLNEACLVGGEEAAAVAAGATPGPDAERLVREVVCLDCHVEFSQLNGRACVKRPVPMSRNHPCPCGSGRKYKHCHGKGR